MMEAAEHLITYRFSLFISPGSAASEQAVYNLKKICEFLGEGDCEVEVINVKDNPQRAEIDRIMAIPTLIKGKPFPALRIIGDLSNHQRVLEAMGYVPRDAIRVLPIT